MTQFYYSPENHGFYRDDVNSKIPSDAIEVTEEDYLDLFSKQAEGETIAFQDGVLTTNPMVISWDMIRSLRDGLLTACDWTQTIDAPITSDEQKAWQVYRKKLRDITVTYKDPEDVIWPAKPYEES